jgi:hypothetical protein
MIKVKDLKTLKALKNHKEGELALVEKDNKVYVYKEDKWVEYNPEDGGLTVSLYDVNKMAMPNLPDLTEEQIEEAKRMVAQFISPKSKFWMLLNNEKRYYTVFQLTDNPNVLLTNKIEDEFIECLKEIGTIKSIEKVDDTTIEAWVIDKEDSEAYAYYLFNYDKGVVVCK